MTSLGVTIWISTRGLEFLGRRFIGNVSRRLYRMAAVAADRGDPGRAERLVQDRHGRADLAASSRRDYANIAMLLRQRAKLAPRNAAAFPWPDLPRTTGSPSLGDRPDAPRSFHRGLRHGCLHSYKYMPQSLALSSGNGRVSGAQRRNRGHVGAIAGSTASMPPPDRLRSGRRHLRLVPG